MRFLVTLFIATIVLTLLQPGLRRLGIGRMPGDFTLRVRGRELLFPFGSTVVLTLLGWLVMRLL
jgi:hypothetical protein